MTLIPNLPTDEGRELGAQFDRFCRVELADRQSRGDPLPERCGTCAFRLGTVANGSPATLMTALKCIMEGDTQFTCHEDGKVCRGAVLLQFEGRVQAPWEFPEGADFVDPTGIMSGGAQRAK